MPDPSGYRPSNPFRTANIRPGANDFLFIGCMNWQRILGQLQQHRWCEIVGPHGTGKSTLFRQLTATCESEGWAVRRHVFDAQQSAWEPLVLNTFPSMVEDAVERLRAVDGFEQLSRGQRRAIRRHCREHGERLLITSHAQEGLHVLYRTHVDVFLAREVIAGILRREGLSWTIDNLLLDKLLTKHRGNLREVLFELFDLFALSPASTAAGAS